MFDRIDDVEEGETVSVGFSIGSAEYRVMDVTEGGWDHMQVSDPPRGSIPDVFSRMDEDVIVDLGAIPEESVAAEWMVSEPGRQGLNSKNDAAKPAHYLDTDPRTIFDALLFVHTGSAAEGFHQ